MVHWRGFAPVSEVSNDTATEVDVARTRDPDQSEASWPKYQVGPSRAHAEVEAGCNCTDVVGGCGAMGAQVQWLRADLAGNPRQCTVAIWHRPRFSSGSNHGSSTRTAPFWEALYDYGADIVLNGHDHDYERFAPQTPQGQADASGIREFVVGTGGRSLYGFGSPVANSEVRYNGGFGVLRLELKPGAYDWQFVSVAGKTFADSGSGVCN